MGKTVTRIPPSYRRKREYHYVRSMPCSERIFPAFEKQWANDDSFILILQYLTSEIAHPGENEISPGLSPTVQNVYEEHGPGRDGTGQQPT